MNCKQCGAELQSQERFCQNCGTETTEQTTPAASAPVMDNNFQNAGSSGDIPNVSVTVNNNPSANNYFDDSSSQKPKAKRQSFNVALGGLVVAIIMMIILFAADYVIVAYITFIAPVISFMNIAKDKKNGHTGFLPTILINIVTLIIAVILFVVYLNAV